MFNVSILLVVCWLIFLAYWVINWKSVKPAQEIAWRSPSFRWTSLGIIIIFILLAHFFLPKGLIRNVFSPQPHFLLLQLVGLILVVIGLIIAILARKTLADNWSSDIEFKKDHKLITTGVYSYARHPIYTGLILMGIGTIMVLQTILTSIFYLGVITFFVFKMKKEEKLLLKHFPKEYAAYMKRTKALIPFIY